MLFKGGRISLCKLLNLDTRRIHRGVSIYFGGESNECSEEESSNSESDGSISNDGE